MAYDGLVNYSVVKELQDVIINGKIDKIFEPNFDEIVLGIYSNGIKYSLDFVVSSQFYRANLTTNAKINPNQAPNFCMTLRKYLLNTRISNIYTNSLERIIFIDFEGYSKSKDGLNKKLIIELMGKHSNIILVDNENIIIDSLKHFSVASGSYRNIFPGEKYELPKSDKLDFMTILDKDEFYRVLSNNSKRIQSTSLANIISNTFTGISKSSITSFETDLNIMDNLDKSNSDMLYEYISTIINRNVYVGCKNFNDGYSLYLSYNKSSETVGNLQINFFLDDYYTEKENKSVFLSYRDNLLNLILAKLGKLNSKLDTLNEKVQECKDSDKYRLYGELITSNLYKIDNHNIDSITLENYYNNNVPITISLDKSITPSMNAKKFFKKYQKLKNAKSYIDEQKSSVINDINYLESIVYEISIAKDVMDIDDIYNELTDSDIILKRKQSKKSEKGKNKKYSDQNKVGELLKFDIDGFTVLVGKNNKQNDYITTKIADKNDIWFHVKDFHGSHVILRTENKTPSPDTIYECAKLAKEYSKAKQSSNIMVDYTYVKFVKKPSGSKPGMVIYTNNKTIVVK